MATSNQSDERFCSFCDPSPVKAKVWCSECDDFLCFDCLKHHNFSKLFKNHSTMSLEDYNELPAVVQTLNYHCADHDEQFDSFCPVHNRPCCIGCFLTSHKECSGVAPMKDFIPNVKSSSAMLDLEQTLKELGSFVRNLRVDKEKNIQDIQTQRKEILEELYKIRKSLNDHLDQLQETLIRSINRTVGDVTLQLFDVKNSLTELENKTSNITLEFNKIKEHASDLQTFLSLPHLISKANDEEKKVDKLCSEGKFNRKTIIFIARTDDIIKMKSIGDVGVDDIKSDVAYFKEKEKQAQIVGPLTRRKNDIINYIRPVQELKYAGGPFYDITSIHTHTIDVSSEEEGKGKGDREKWAGIKETKLSAFAKRRMRKEIRKERQKQKQSRFFLKNDLK